MCARYVLEKNALELAAILKAAVEGEYEPSWNIAPTRVAPVLLRSRRDGSRRIEIFRWGLLPPWAQEAEGAKLVNVRSETVFEKATSREPARARRCLVPVSGWYEWRREGRRSQPFYVTDPAREVTLLAGVWNARRRESGDFLFTYGILTRDAEGDVAAVHHRMPVALADDAAEAWLAPGETQPQEALAAALGGALTALRVRPVSPAVNDVRREGPALIEPFALPLAPG